MISWPEPGTRVTVRYRRPAGSVPPLTDVVGRLLETAPLVCVQTKTGAVVHFAPDNVVALRALSDTPLRTSDIRALEHTDAMAWPGIERQWLDGWLLRAGKDDAESANSAVPLNISASKATIPTIVGWYRSRGLTPRLAVADRLMRLSDTGERANRMLVRDLRRADECVEPAVQPGVDGEPTVGRHADNAAAQAAVTDAPDGTRWVGLSARHRATHDQCEALLAWGASRGATRGYIRVRDDDQAAADLARSLGFVLHHHARYITVSALT